LSRARLKSVESHLDGCPECTSSLSLILAAARPGTAEEETALSRIPGADPRSALERARVQIIASSPSPGARRPSFWRLVMPPAAALVTAGFALFMVNLHWIAPKRSRSLAGAALADLARLRHGTGKIPLRFITSFERARVTRSGFETEELDPVEESIEARLRRAVALAPREYRARLGLGLFLLDLGRKEEAELELRQALEMEPEGVEAANALAVLYYLRAEEQGGDELLRQGLELLLAAQRRDPTDLQVSYNLGLFYLKLGEARLAERAFGYYLRLDRDSDWASLAREHLAELEAEGAAVR
jgi:tetratricopeptide (TPR) repeat protein